MNSPLKLPTAGSNSSFDFVSDRDDAIVERALVRLAPAFDLEEAAILDPALVASRILENLGARAPLPKVVVLVGHESAVSKRPARTTEGSDRHALVASLLLDDARVREELLELDTEIPKATLFVPAFINTATNRIELVAPFFVPPSHRKEVYAALRWFEIADDSIRRERLAKLFEIGSSPRESGFDFRSAS